MSGFATDLAADLYAPSPGTTDIPVIDSVFDVADAAAAHRRLETSQLIGTNILRVA